MCSLSSLFYPLAGVTAGFGLCIAWTGTLSRGLFSGLSTRDVCLGSRQDSHSCLWATSVFCCLGLGFCLKAQSGCCGSGFYQRMAGFLSPICPQYLQLSSWAHLSWAPVSQVSDNNIKWFGKHCSCTSRSLVQAICSFLSLLSQRLRLGQEPAVIDNSSSNLGRGNLRSTTPGSESCTNTQTQTCQTWLPLFFHQWLESENCSFRSWCKAPDECSLLSNS